MVVGYNMKIMHLISKQFEHNQFFLLFFLEDEDVHRTNSDFDIKCENGSKVSGMVCSTKSQRKYG